MLSNIIHSFMSGLKHVRRKDCHRADKKMRAGMSERQIDHMLEDSFPASDPPSTY